jgi:hypothetical protein
LKSETAPAFAGAVFVFEAGRQRAAAESSLTDRINLSVAEAFVNVGSLTSVESIHQSIRAQIEQATAG